MKKLGMMILMALVATVAVHAETLALWELDDVLADSSSATVDTVHSNMAASTLDAGAGLATAISWPNALGGLADWNLSPSLQYAIETGDDYFSFTLTPDAGQMATYSNLFARFAVNAGDDGAYVQFHLLSDKTGFTTNGVLGTFTVEDNVAPNYSSIIYENSFDLSAVSELQGVQGDTEFRIYVTATNGNRMAIGHNNYVNFTDDLRVDGFVQVATSPPPVVVVELAKWELDDLAASQSTGTVDWVHADMASTDLIAQPGGFSTGIAWPNAMGGFADWHLGGSLEWTLQNSPNNYFTITLTPDSGKVVSYKNLFARFAVNTGDDGAYVQFHLLSDKTGFTTNNILGTFTVEDNVAPNYSSIIYTHDFDMSTIPELQDLTEAIEFRIYATATNGNRMAIGHNHFVNGTDDLVVSGTIEDLPYVPATIVDWEFVSGSVMKLVVDAPADPALYYPKGSTDLTAGFSGVAHSDDAGGPFVITNLSYSTAEGDNEAIYVETTEAAKFFGIGQ